MSGRRLRGTLDARLRLQRADHHPGHCVSGAKAMRHVNGAAVPDPFASSAMARRQKWKKALRQPRAPGRCPNVPRDSGRPSRDPRIEHLDTEHVPLANNDAVPTPQHNHPKSCARHRRCCVAQHDEQFICAEMNAASHTADGFSDVDRDSRVGARARRLARDRLQPPPVEAYIPRSDEWSGPLIPRPTMKYDENGNRLM